MLRARTRWPTWKRGATATLRRVDPPRTVAGLDFSLPSADERRPSAMFPGLTFLQALFGCRSLPELEAAFPDCVVRGPEPRALLEALFPKQPSKVWPIL